MAGLSRGCQYRLVRGQGNNAECSGARDMGGREGRAVGWMKERGTCGLKGKEKRRDGD